MEQQARMNPNMVNSTVYQNVRAQEGIIQGSDGTLYDQDGNRLSWWKTWIHGWIVDKEQKRNQLENPIWRSTGKGECVIL